MEYTLVVTSCDRHDLLKETLESFIQFADQKPKRTIIVEDSAKPAPAWLDSVRAPLGGILWIPNGKRLGQVYSIDLAYSYVETPFIFHCEDDWRFLRTGFIEKSFRIMDMYGGISTCNLRGDKWCHPFYNDPRYPFKVAAPYWLGPWGGLSWNPGLRRRGDYVRIGSSYGKHIGYTLGSCTHEELISKKYLDMGYNVAWADDEPFIEHIGDGRSRAATKLEAAPKILIAIPACREMNYGKWVSGGVEEPREGVHVNGVNPRIAAIRDTWWKDVAKHENVTAKFFYGQPSGDLDPFHGDEIYLTCPDDYESLPLKTKAIAKYALDSGYDYLFKCDDDTACYVERLVGEIMSIRPEWAGYFHGTMAMSGGPGYILSKRALKYVAEMQPSSWAEDVSVTFALSNRDFFPAHLEGHRPGFSDHWFFPKGFDPTRLNNRIVTMHAVQPDVMRAWYEYKEGNQ